MTPKRTCLALVIGSLCLSGATGAQAPLRGDEPMPPGHPPTASTAAPADDPTEDGEAAGTDLPPGHPPTASTATPTDEPTEADGEGMPAGHPPTGGSLLRSAPPPDRVLERPDLPAGTVVVALRQADGTPLAGHAFDLIQHEHDVAEGDSIERLAGVTDAAGQARFDDLPRETSYSYTVVAKEGPATYRSEEFQLHKGGGRQVITHVFPVVRDVREALVGMRGIAFLEPRTDMIQVELSFQVFNIGRTTWVPADVSFPLPPSASAFRTRDAEAESRFEQRGDRVVLVGTFGPGQKEVAFSFQIPASGQPAQSFDIHLPPRVAEMRVAAAIGRDAELRVEGFDPARHVRGNDGSWLAMTGQQAVRGGTALAKLSVALDGLHAPGRGRWIAAGIALAIAGLGLASSLSRPRTAKPSGDTEHAMGLLFAELEALEKLKQAEKIGPRTYERARATLIEALTRLEAAKARGGGEPSPA